MDVAKAETRENRRIGNTLRKIQGYLKRPYHHERCVYAECIQETGMYRICFAGNYG